MAQHENYNPIAQRCSWRICFVGTACQTSICALGKMEDFYGRQGCQGSTLTKKSFRFLTILLQVLLQQIDFLQLLGR